MTLAPATETATSGGGPPKRPPLRLEDLVPKDDEREALIDREGLAHYFIAADSLKEQAQTKRFWKRAQELEAIEEPTEEDTQAYRGLLLDFTGLIVPTIDKDALHGLSNNVLWDVIQAFHALQGLGRARLQTWFSARLTSPTSSPGSASTTAPTSG